MGLLGFLVGSWMGPVPAPAKSLVLAAYLIVMWVATPGLPALGLGNFIFGPKTAYPPFFCV